MTQAKRRVRTERYVVVKEPDVKRLFEHSIERFRIGDKAQMTIQGAPEVTKVITIVTAYYVRAIGTIRLYSSGSTGWAMPLAVEPNDDYTAITLALSELRLFEDAVPDFQTGEEAVTAWKLKMQRREDRDANDVV